MPGPLDDLTVLCKRLFKIDLFGYQVDIIRHIVNDSRKVTIRAATRAGKSYAVAIGIVLYCIFNDNKRVGVVAPNADKSKIIMNYVSDLLVSNPDFMDFVQTDKKLSKLERQRKELSKRKLSFNNGTTLEIRSVNLQARGFGVTGFGYDLTVIDESAEIPDECYYKIYRMLVESKTAKIVEIGNPWFLNHFYKNHHNSEWKAIHISWKDCVSQGRMSQSDIDDQRKNQSDLEFKVLFDADFPDSEDDTLISQSDISRARRLFRADGTPVCILGVDCARFGRNKTVFTYTKRFGNLFVPTAVKEFTKCSTGEVAGHIIAFARENHCDIINVDAGGVGGGVYDLVEEHFTGDNFTGHRPKVCDLVMSDKPLNSHHLNFKTSVFQNLQDLFKEGRIIISDAVAGNDLLHQLAMFRFTYTSNGKKKIIDGQDTSPDYADSLAYSCWDEGAFVVVDW